jgi:hypothetical protein
MPVVNLEKFLLEQFMPYFLLLTWRNKIRNRMWWVEPQQKKYILMLLKAMYGIVHQKWLIGSTFNLIG